MEIIHVENLEKVYRIPKKRDGIINAFKDLIKREWNLKVALKNINLSINEGEIVGYIRTELRIQKGLHLLLVKELIYIGICLLLTHLS